MEIDAELSIWERVEKYGDTTRISSNRNVLWGLQDEDICRDGRLRIQQLDARLKSPENHDAEKDKRSWS